MQNNLLNQSAGKITFSTGKELAERNLDVSPAALPFNS